MKGRRVQVAGELVVEQRPGAPAPDPDLCLVRDARAGDSAAFDRLVERHWRQLVSIAGRFLDDPNEAEDAVQEALVRAYHGLGSFREEASARTWLIRIVVNVCRNRRTSGWRRLVCFFDRVPEVRSASPDPRLLAEAALEHEEVAAALARLPDRLRLPVVLHFYHDLSGPEIASVLGWNESTVWTRIYAAYRKLRKQLQG